MLGPLLGGLFTDHLSWRWAFYVNLPLGVAVVVLAAFTIPNAAAVSRPAIDYLGVGFVSLGAAGLVLGLSWGGTQYPWDSATILGLFAGSLVALALFVFFESRAVDPILPLRLFRRQVFSLSVVLAFIVGFAMLGALTFLPTYFQYVRGVSATASGIQTLPLVVGLLVTSVASGHARRPHRPLQDLPRRRVAGDGYRAVPAVVDGPHRPVTRSWPSPCSCSAPASG